MGTEKNNEIRINKKMRNWNKYKHYIIGGAAIIVLVIIVVLVAKSCGKSNETPDTTTSPIKTTTQAATEQVTTSAAAEATTAEATTAATAGGVFTTTKTVAKEDFTQEEYYAKSVFLGDAIVNGIEYYKFLDDSKVVSDVNMTTDKATNYVTDIVSASPEKIFIMLGINDLNYGSRTTEKILSNYQALVDELHTKLPSAKIYIISVLPITKTYESKTTVYITKSGIDDLNKGLQAMAGTSNVSYINIATAFSDNTGYLDSSVSGNGVNLTSTYYGFLLNTIAEMAK